MKTSIELSISGNSMVALPDSGKSVYLLKNPKDNMLHDVVTQQKNFIRDVSIYLYNKELQSIETAKAELEIINKEIEAAELSLKTYNDIKELQESSLKSIKTSVSNAKNDIISKQNEQNGMKASFNESATKTSTLKGELEDLLKNKLNALTKEITEALVKDIHRILSNESKDPKQIDIINSIVSILRNTKIVDHVIVNVY